MNRTLRLTRGIVNLLFFASGAASATYGWWFLVIFVPSFALCVWHNYRVDRLISVAIGFSFQNITTQENSS